LDDVIEDNEVGVTTMDKVGRQSVSEEGALRWGLKHEKRPAVGKSWGLAF